MCAGAGWCAGKLLERRTVDCCGAFGHQWMTGVPLRHRTVGCAVIEDDGYVLWGSNAIVRYLAPAMRQAISTGTRAPRRRRQGPDGLDRRALAGPFPRPVQRCVRRQAACGEADPQRRCEPAAAELLRLPGPDLADQPWLSGERFRHG